MKKLGQQAYQINQYCVHLNRTENVFMYTHVFQFGRSFSKTKFSSLYKRLFLKCCFLSIKFLRIHSTKIGEKFNLFFYILILLRINTYLKNYITTIF